MAFLRKLGMVFSTLCWVPHAAFAADSFTVKNIQVEGLQGLSAATVESYMPIKVGQSLHASDTSTIIAALYQTGFFSNVRLLQQGDTLVVQVIERPIIASIKVSGNSAISTDQINGVLKDLGLVQGQVLDQAVLDEVTKSLESAYDAQGHYNATVNTSIVAIARHRVNVTMTVSEGRVALVENIHVIGNHAFSEKALINTLTLATPKWNSFYTRADHYSKEAFTNSLQALTAYYLDHGYLHFKIDSANAVLTPDRKSVRLIIHVTEGEQYRLQAYDFVGNLVLPVSQYKALPQVKALETGKVFSRQQLTDASKAMTGLLGEQGYAFAEVNIVPTIDEQNKTVSVSFQVNPGNRVYARRIHFTGNTKTSDAVLRSAMRQMEGGLVSTSAIDESIRQLNLLGYFQNIKEETTPVPGSQNQVDLNYAVTEQPSAQATIGAGYGTDGVVFNAGVNESNFMGTGKQVGVNFANSVYQRSYSFNYNNPYYTPDGVQRGFNFYNTQTNPGALNIAPYSFTNYGGNMVYTVPFSAKDNYQLGLGLQRTSLSEGIGPSAQIQAFVDDEGKEFNQTMLSAGWTRNGLDRAFFPTQGLLQNLGVQVSAPFIGNALEYYKLSYQFHGYQSLSAGFIGSFVGSFGYGGGYGKTQGLPFFTNYYAGGLGTQGQVRGYETNSLGPQDSTNVAFGGNELMSGSAQLILPGPMSGDSFRTSIFVDAGNVYSTWNMYNTYGSNQVGTMLGNLRYSTGVDLQWRLPVLNATLEFSLAKALHSQKGDLTEPFSFNIGGNF